MKNQTTKSWLMKMALLVCLMPATALAGNLNYANVPLFWAAGVKPNIVLLIDESLSMQNMSFSQDYSDWLKADTSTTAYKNYDDDWYFCTTWDSTKSECSAANTTSIAQLVGAYAGDTGDISANYFVAVNGSQLYTSTGSGRSTIVRCNVNTSPSGAQNTSGDGLMVTNANPAVARPSAGTTTSTTYTDTYTFNAFAGVGRNAITFTSEVRTPAGSTVHLLASGDKLIYNSNSCAVLRATRGGFGGLVNGTTYTVRSANGSVPNQTITLNDSSGNQVVFRNNGAPTCTTEWFTLTPQITVGGGGSGSAIVPGSDPQRRVVDACVRLREASTARATTTNPAPPAAGTSSWESRDIPIATGSTVTVPVSYTIDYSSADGGNRKYDTWWTTPYIQFLLNKAFEPVTQSTATTTRIPSSNSGLVLDMFNPPASSSFPVVSSGAGARVEVPPDNRLQTVRKVAMAAIGNNKDVANFGITIFTTQKVPSADASAGFGTSDASCSSSTTQWCKLEQYLTKNFTSWTGGTPLAKTLDYIVGNFSSGAEKITYRCQKNFAIIMTDGEPTADYTTGDQDKVPDAIFSNMGYLDDIAEKGYYLDFKTSGTDSSGNSWGSATINGTSLPAQITQIDTATTANPYWQQNMVTYTIGFGATNDLLTMTPVVNRIKVPSTNITLQNPMVTDASKNGFITIKNHGLNSGDTVIYETVDRISGATMATANGLMAQVSSSAPVDILPSHIADNEQNTDGIYYAVHLSNDDFALATSLQNATANPPVTVALNSVAAGDYWFSTGPGRTYVSTSAQDLSLSLGAAISQIRALTSSASAVAANSSQLNTSTRVYQATFSTSGWVGDLFAYPIDVTTGQVNFSAPDWEVDKTVTTGNVGTLLTWNPSANSGNGAGTYFSSASGALSTNFSAAQLASLGANTNEQQDVINWVSGQTNLASFVSSLSLRDRPVSIVGDILNSSPQYLGPTDYGYNSISSSYAAYVTGKASKRQMLFWGGGDGMLHGIDASTGLQLVGYIPAGVYQDFIDNNSNGINDAGDTVINKLYNLAQDTYGLTTFNQHEYYVDGSPTINDAQFADGTWHTVIVGGLNAGGRSIYALDVSNPTSFSTANVLWEFSDPRLGHTFSRPIIARLQNGQFAAIFGNGYDSLNDFPRLFIVLLDRQGQGFIEGTNFWVLENTNATYSPNVNPASNGISGVAPLLDANNTLLAVYGGDLQGNVWKFELYGSPSATPGAGWQVAYSNAPFFTAWDNTVSPAVRQPITSPPAISKNSSGYPMVYVATGKYMETGDNAYSSSTSIPHVNTVYGLEDNCTDANCSNGSTFGNPTSVTGRPTGILVQQQLYSFMGTGTAANTKFRSVTDYPVDWTTKRGWYEDLVDAPNPPPSAPVASAFLGELVFKQLTVHKTALIYPTAIPAAGDPCSTSGSSYLMEVSLENGGLVGPVFDVNGDGVVSATETASAGVFNSSGFFSEPVIFDASSTSLGAGELKVMSVAGSGSTAITVKEVPQTSAALPKSGRSSWRQLQ